MFVILSNGLLAMEARSIPPTGSNIQFKINLRSGEGKTLARITPSYPSGSELFNSNVSSTGLTPPTAKDLQKTALHLCAYAPALIEVD